MKRIDTDQKHQLQLKILSLVKKGTTSANQLFEQITEQGCVSETRLFHPALSGLNRSNELCWHWKYSESAPPEKHFFLTSKGEKKIMNQLAVV